MKKRILIATSIVLLFFVGSLLVAGGIVTKGWDYVPVRGDILFVQNITDHTVAIRWDYYTIDNDGNIVIMAPGAYRESVLKERAAFDYEDSNGKISEDFYYFYDDDANADEFIIQRDEKYLLPTSVWNVYIEKNKESKHKIVRGSWKYGVVSREDENDVFIPSKDGAVISIQPK